MSDARLIEGTRKRINLHDYEAVFAHGGCFHFALRLKQRFGYQIRGIRESHDRRSLSHVWCVKPDGKGVDIRGVYPEDFLARLANGGASAQVFDVAVEEIREIIASKGYTPSLETELGNLADWIVDNHERFESAKPVDENLYHAFRKEMDARCNDSAL